MLVMSVSFISNKDHLLMLPGKTWRLFMRTKVKKPLSQLYIIFGIQLQKRGTILMSISLP